MITGFLHFIWLGGSPNFSAWKGIRRWSAACNRSDIPLHDRICPILWIDSAAQRAMVAEHLQYSTNPTYSQTYKPKYIFEPLPQTAFHTNIYAQLGPIRSQGYMIGAFNQPIPIANIDENFGLFEEIVVREPDPKYRLGSPAFRDLVLAMQTEANIEIGGAPVLASDMLRILLLRCFGGIYVDAVGIEPLLIPLSRSSVEINVLQKARVESLAGQPPIFTRTGIVVPFDNWGIITDVTENEIKLLLTHVIRHYAGYYQNNPFHGIEERLAEYAKAIGDPALTMPDYLADLKKFGMNFRRVLSHDVTELNSKKYPEDSSWLHGPTVTKTFADDEDSDTDIFGRAIAGRAAKSKPRPDIKPETEALIAAYRKAQLGPALGHSINNAGFEFFMDCVRDYTIAKGIISLAELSWLIFGQTPLKGHMICSYEHPFIGRARNYWEAANTFGLIQGLRKRK